MYYWETVPSGVAILLALCNFPKAVMAVIEATSKPLRVLDLDLQDSERDLFVWYNFVLIGIRLVMQVWGWGF